MYESCCESPLALLVTWQALSCKPRSPPGFYANIYIWIAHLRHRAAHELEQQLPQRRHLHRLDCSAEMIPAAFVFWNKAFHILGAATMKSSVHGHPDSGYDAESPRDMPHICATQKLCLTSCVHARLSSPRHQMTPHMNAVSTWAEASQAARR